MKYKNIDDAIKSGYKLHIFISGGGLRVCRLEDYDGSDRDVAKGNKLVAYGEHINLVPALKKVDENIITHAPYETEYYSGNANADCELDKIILRGETIDIIPCEDAHTWQEGKVVKAGDTLGDRCYNVNAVTIIVKSLGVEILRLVGADVNEVLNRAEAEAKYINTNGVTTI